MSHTHSTEPGPFPTRFSTRDILDDSPATPATVVNPARETGSLAQVQPTLADGVDLLGEMLGSGFADAMWLVQIDARFIQLTELLYRIAEQCDGQHTVDDIATRISRSTQWKVSSDDVQYLVEKKLMPIGIIAVVDKADPGLKTQPTAPPSLLQLGLKRGMISAEAIEPIARRLQVLFAPALLIPLLLAGLVTHGWLYLDHGIDGLLANALYTPGLLLLIFVMSVLPGFWHEFGHATALRYGGGRARSIGMGIYVMDPAFYTDVTDSYRLGRWARIRTGLGGIYFDLILSTLLIAAYLATGVEALLLVVILSNINTLYQFFPLVRLDGYWILADLTGVPDFYSLMGSFVRSVVPVPGWKGARLPDLKPWVKVFFMAYTIIAIPGLVFFMYVLLGRIPDILAVSADAMQAQAAHLPTAWEDGAWLTIAASISQLLLLSLTLIGLAYFLASLVRVYVSLLVRLARSMIGRIRLATLPEQA